MLVPHATSPSFRRQLGAFGVALLLIAGLFPAAMATPRPASAAPTDLFFSEYVEGTSNNKALEIYNGTGSAIDLATGGYNVQMYFNGNTSAGLTINLTGTVAADDVFVLAQSSAAAAILAQADQTNGAGWFNGDDAVVLRKGTTVLDVIGQIGVDPGSEWGSGLTSTSDNTLRRKTAIEAGDTNGADTFDPAVEWDGLATDTFDGLGSHSTIATPPAATAVINEFSASTTGTDVEYVEIYGTASTDFSSLTILEIEGDADSNEGEIDGVFSVGTTDADGFWHADLPANALENATLTLLLVDGFTGSAGADLDTDDDGTLDATPWTEVVDAVAISDGGSSDRTYGVPALGPNYDGVSTFAPGGASRIPDGTDTDTASDWVRNDFDLAGIDGYTGTIGVGEAYNTPGEPNVAYEPPPAGECGEPTTAIHDIQGSGASSPLVGTSVFIEGVVVGDFQNNASPDDGDLNGFYLQAEDADVDADPATSEGIFVRNAADDVSVGDHVRVAGAVAEFTGSGSSQTQVNADALAVCASDVALPSAASVTLPVAQLSDLERYEGMRVSFAQTLTISEYFNFDRFNEVVLTVDRQFQPTAVAEPGSAEAAAIADLNARSRITLDDGRSTQNPDPAIHPNGDEFDLTNRFRGGDTVTGVTGVIDHTFGLYRVQPTQAADYTAVNSRTSAPDPVGGSLTVASFNVLNYFTTLTSAGDVCGPEADLECRGADTATEFERQRAKIIAALAAIDADVVGLIEIENHPTDVPTANLVAGLNEEMGAGTYAYVPTGAIGTDAIRVAFIYKPASVSLVGDYAILDSTVDPRFDDDRSRPVLAQTFEEVASGGIVTVAVNHLKSKGSSCGAGDDDPEQGNCNATRTAAAEAMVDWLAGDPTGSGDADVLITGDLNAYDHEDPIDVLSAGVDGTASTGDDYTDLVKAYVGEEAYSYAFNGQLGYLDHALTSPTLTPQVTGTTIWHINADEPDILDYDMSFKKAAQDALYEPNPYRSSDHDPVIVGLDLLAYDFDGFYPPVTNPPASNTVKAGQVVPIEFSLGGDYGLDVLFQPPQVFVCGTWPTGTSIDAATPGRSSLEYSSTSDAYTFPWETARSWANSCRTLIVTFDDGTYRTATFELTR